MNRVRSGIAFAFILVFCASATAQTASSEAVLRVGTSGDYAPFSVRDSTGAWSGFDIAVAQRLAADLGRRIEFVPFQWPELETQLRAGAFDIAMSGVTVRADRAVAFGFSRPYIATGAVAAVRVRDRRRFRELADLDRSNVRIAVNRGGHLERVARERFPHARLQPVGDNSALADMLRRAEVDAVISDVLEVHAWAADDVATIGPFTHDRKAYMLPRASTALLQQVNDWLAAREADGWLNEQRQRWLGKQSGMSKEQAALEALVAAIDLRLHLMPLVAAVKRREQLPIDDPAQEARVLDRVRGAATAAGLHPDDVAALFRVQIAAARAIEHAATNTVAPPSITLTDVRAAIAAASSQIIDELARCAPWLHAQHGRAQLDTAARTGLTAPGMTRAFTAELVEALRHVRLAAAQTH